MATTIQSTVHSIKPIRANSKQLNYYYHNREQINLNRRTQYKTHKKYEYIQKKYLNIIKSKDILTVINSSLSKADNSQNKPILSLFDLLTHAQTHLIPENEVISNILMKTTCFSFYPEIVQYVNYNGQASFSELERFLKEKISTRQLKRAIQLLVNLKWLIRRGKNDFTVYYINPFLSKLYKTNPQYAILLAEYARLKVDLFDLLNVPLIYALRSNQKFIKSEVEFHKYNRTSEWEHAFFEGYVNIKISAQNGDVYQTYLPVNFHASPKLDWVNGYRVQDRYGFPHHTLPLKWVLFDVLEGRTFSKKSRKSRWSKEVGEYEYIHFDNSFKILHYVDKAQYLMFNKPFQNALKKWNTKACEYVEVSSFELLEKLFYCRFVENKRRKELFEALELRYKPISGRPKLSMNS